MMCGLPGSGKTYYVDNLVKENPEKNYSILGTNALMKHMKVSPTIGIICLQKELVCVLSDCVIKLCLLSRKTYSDRFEGINLIYD